MVLLLIDNNLTVPFVLIGGLDLELCSHPITFRTSNGTVDKLYSEMVMMVSLFVCGQLLIWCLRYCQMKI